MKDHDPFDLRGQQRNAEEAERRERSARLNQAEDFKWLMSDARGRRFVWRLLELSGMYRTSMTGNSTTFFNEGMRNFGIMLTSLAHENGLEEYMLMVAENRNGPQQTESKK